MEQVVGFRTTLLKDGMSPLDMFVTELTSILDDDLKQLYTGVEILQLEPMPFLDIPRKRLSRKRKGASCYTLQMLGRARLWKSRLSRKARSRVGTRTGPTECKFIWRLAAEQRRLES